MTGFTKGVFHTPDCDSAYLMNGYLLQYIAIEINYIAIYCNSTILFCVEICCKSFSWLIQSILNELIITFIKYICMNIADKLVNIDYLHVPH